MQTQTFKFNTDKLLGSIYVQNGEYREYENALMETIEKIKDDETFSRVPRDAQYRDVVDAHIGFYADFEDLVLEMMYRQWRIREPRAEGNKIHENFGAHMARFLQDKGSIVDMRPTLYGWHGGGHKLHQQLKKARIVGIYDIQELTWKEFEGTFVENSEHSGIQAYLVTNTGLERYVRYRGSMADVLSYD